MTQRVLIAGGASPAWRRRSRCVTSPPTAWTSSPRLPRAARRAPLLGGEAPHGHPELLALPRLDDR